jgi:SPP1 family phage portal protein
MSDETLKVNEFEHAIDEVHDYRTNETFQQVYWNDEANMEYRAATAEEILGDATKLQAMIQHHYEHQVPRLVAIHNYKTAKNTGIYNDGSRRKEPEKADHRAAHNFAKVISVFDVGYNTGIPIKKTSDDEAIAEIVREYDVRNDAETLDADLWSDFKEYGRAYELQYRDADDFDWSVLCDVLETFVCYDLSVAHEPLFAVRYPRYKVGMEERTQVQVYTPTEIITYKPCAIGTLNLVEDHRENHSWGEVPITEYTPNRDRMGGYEDVITLIDLYDAAQSDTANYMSDFNDATLVISGDLDLEKYSVEDTIAMKKANMLLLANGINPDGSKTQTSADYIYKQYDSAGTEAYKDRIRKDIHSISLIPDLTDEAFAGTQSGEAMKYKLFGFLQVTKMAQNGFRAGLKRRYRLLLNIKNSVQEADNTDLGNFTIKFTPNLPKAVLDELKMLVDAGAQFSQETLLELASFIEDVQAEFDRIEAENETQESAMDKLLYNITPTEEQADE